MAFLSDTHCHLNLPPLENRIDIVIEAAEKNNVKRFLVPGLDVRSSKSSLSMHYQYPKKVYPAVGIHPNYSYGATEEDFFEIEKIASGGRICAIGEIGLDFYRDFSTKITQVDVFSKMLEIAKNHHLPICIHNRDADEELIQILDDWVRNLHNENNPLVNHPGVFHSFNGSRIIFHWALNHKFLLGISGPVTFPKSVQLRQMVAEIDLNYLLIETDSPYLTPIPFRGKINEPKNVVHIAEEIARLKDMSLEHVAETTSENANRLFDWD